MFPRLILGSKLKRGINEILGVNKDDGH
jgi:hypothetical protein